MEPSAGLDQSTKLVERYFTTAEVDPLDAIEWGRRDVWVDTKHEHLGVEAPASWSDNAVAITSKLYLSKAEGSRENSVRELIERIAKTISDGGLKHAYFGELPVTSAPGAPAFLSATAFYDELRYILVNQLAVFNSPVLFNVGRSDREPQVSACQPYHALISTPSGPMPIGRIVEIKEKVPQQGLRVCSALGDADVLAVKRNGVKDVLRITTKSGQQLDVTTDHLVWSATRRQHVQAGALSVGERVEWHRISEMEVEPVHQDHDLWTAEAALAGWLQTDGFVGKYEGGTNKSMTIEALSVTEAERIWVHDQIERVFPDVHRHHSTEVTLDKTLDFRRVRLYGTELEKFVDAYGLLARREGKLVPQRIVEGHRDQVVSYLRSVFQADGYVAAGKVALHTISHDFVLGLRSLLARLGIFSRISAVQDRRPNRKPGWVLRIGALPDRRRFAVDVGFIDERKQSKLRATLDDKGIADKATKTLTIDSIESIGEMEVFDIQTSTGEYLADGLRVHNCFILGVEDTTESIKETASREIDIFRGGSGSGFDVSRMRGSMEPLSIGGLSSGPVSFMRFWDAGAGTFKSGGTTRRAAKLVKLDVDHPDIREFITCKVREEDRLRRAVEHGENVGFDEEGERNVAEQTSYQNANNSVGVMNSFMRLAVDPPDPDEDQEPWPLYARSKTWRDQHDGNDIVSWDSPVDLLDLIAESAHACACPGMMFMDAINAMHTTPRLDGVASPIRSSNPCGEYLSNDDTSCNLGSVNVLKFMGEDGSFDAEGFRHVVDVMALAMEILVTIGYFPDPKIEDRSRKLRQLGLGYSNMGAAIMAQGFAYDSDKARYFAAGVTALLTGRVYRKSAQVAKLLGPFHYFEENREAMLGVIQKHRSSIVQDAVDMGDDVWVAADDDWREAAAIGAAYGFRNAQATVIPPAGTTSYFLDCDTTGIEPSFMLVIHKELAGGGMMEIVNQSVERGLRALGCNADQVDQLKGVLVNHGPEAFLSYLHPDHRSVFHGANEISAEGHIRMMAAVQPFVSGAISKTINMSDTATVDDVKGAYVLGWRLGLKDLAIYRNGSKARQPHSAKPKSEDEAKKQVLVDIVKSARAQLEHAGVEMNVTPTEKIVGGPQAGAKERRGQISPPTRTKLPRSRQSLTHKIHLRGQIGEWEGYVMAGKYPDGRLGEMFIEGFGRAGSFTQNALAAWATDFSIAIQHDIDWRKFARKHLGVADETGGMVVPDPESSGPMPIRSAKSIFDYIVRWLALEFGDADDWEEFGVRKIVEDSDPKASTYTIQMPLMDEGIASNGKTTMSGPQCHKCGHTMRGTGGCFTCTHCFESTGCG
jgi:ribonucleoside-diphosphate reductase alpha chain